MERKFIMPTYFRRLISQDLFRISWTTSSRAICPYSASKYFILSLVVGYQNHCGEMILFARRNDDHWGRDLLAGTFGPHLSRRRPSGARTRSEWVPFLRYLN